MIETGKLFVVAAPSGAGKTSLVKALVATTPDIEVAVSHTTRPKRPDEVDGVNYFFVGEDKFKQMVEKHKFAEWALVFGSYYGTSKQEVERILGIGHHLVLEIDWQGAAQIRTEIPSASTIFILPPSLPSLRERLTNRAQDDEQTVQGRMDAAIDEISHYIEFDYLVVNDNFDVALNDLIELVAGTGENLRAQNQMKELDSLVSCLLQDGQKQ
jgi:guanylate kinase